MFTVRLPTYRTLPALALAAIATVLLCGLLYYVPQRWHVGTPRLLPFTWVDQAVPFWPLSGLVYFALFPFLVGTFLSLRSFDRASRFLHANLLAQILGFLVFVLWPTAFPREVFVLPADAGPLAAALVAFCRNADLPVNCLPSLHVSTATICLATLRTSKQWSRHGIALILLACLAMIASTLTFKQHYLVDAIAGAALGYASWWTCFHQRRSDRVPSSST
jgi:membrane-associated phospholipid phosphatase